MKNSKNSDQSLLGKVVARNYETATGPSPSFELKNLRRHDRILARMRKAGISEEDISFLSDFYQADVAHVWKLIEASNEFEQKKARVN